MTEHRNRLIEFTDGFLDVLPIPTDKHQSVLKFLVFAFCALVETRGGNVQFAPLRLRIRPGKSREPDFLASGNRTIDLTAGPEARSAHKWP